MMPLGIQSNKILNSEMSFVLGVSFRVDEFPGKIKEHRQTFPTTAEAEQLGAHLINCKRIEWRDLENFIKKVCRWGNYAGIAGKVIRHNSEQRIIDHFTKAIRCLRNGSHQIDLALKEVNSLKGLGQPSFASKHLRFLSPELCPVYDSILNSALPYEYNPQGYSTFASDCRLIARRMNTSKIKNPTRKNTKWLAADIESCIFMHFYRNE